jgi:glycosyltransferase involved in cell wall biosynthesis
MRIFMLVQQSGARGSVPTLASHLVAALRSLGCTVVTHPWGQHRETESFLQKVRRLLRDLRSIHGLLRGQAFDVAVVKTSHDWRTLLRDIAVVRVIRPRCRPVVLQLHGSRSSWLVEPGRHAFKLATALLLASVDGIMVLSKEEQRQWQTFRPRPPVFTVKNPYVSVFPTTSPNSASTLGPSPRVLFVGRLIETKGIFELVEAFPSVLEQTPCRLVLVGEGARELELRQRIHRLGLEDHVTIPGYLSGSDLGDQYRAASLFVLPSWSEGFPTVLAEAMDAGLPIVTTRIRGAADHLVAGENALLVEPRDVEGLAAAMTQLLRDDNLRVRMASANRERLQMFEPETVAGEYLEVLRETIRERLMPPKRRARPGRA